MPISNAADRLWPVSSAVVALLVLAVGIHGQGNTGSSSSSSNAAVIQSRTDLSDFSTSLNELGLSASRADTIFAPNNDAFAAYESDNKPIWDIYQTAPFLLHRRELFQWHLVTEGKFTADQIFDGSRQRLQNVNGNITIDQPAGTLDGTPKSAIIEPNIATSDGIVHVTDRFIVPPPLTTRLIDALINDKPFDFSFSTMVSLALAVGLDEQINQIYDEGITFLVPPNRRFFRAEIDPQVLLREENADYTRDFVLCHLIEDNYYVFELEKEKGKEVLIKSLLGTSMWIATNIDNEVFFQSTAILLPDRAAQNGVYHGMDAVLQPPFITDFLFFTHQTTSQDTETMYQFFVQARMTSQQVAEKFGVTLTVWAPSGEAFDRMDRNDRNRLLEPVWIRHSTEFLYNHISAGALSREDWVTQAPGSITMLNNQTYELRKSGTTPRIRNGPTEQARSEFGDIIALDGVVHMIDTVITPTALSQTIYAKCEVDPNLSTLTININLVDLSSDIADTIPITFFAPNNRAFDRITFGALEGGDIIKQHIFAGLLFKDVLANETEITSVSGITQKIEVFGDNKESVWVGGAYIYEADVLAKNGVFHYIDRVIGFEYATNAPTITPSPTITAQPTVFVRPTIPPGQRPSGPVVITFPPQFAPKRNAPTVPSSNQRNSNNSSGASLVRSSAMAMMISCMLGALFVQVN